MDELVVVEDVLVLTVVEVEVVIPAPPNLLI